MMQNKIIIGLTGGSGSGKSVVAKAACDLGFIHIDTDVIGHNIILKGEIAYNKIIDAFGTDILKSNGEIDRKKLGNIVFSDKSKLDLLSSITHPEIIKKTISKITDSAIIDGAVIHKTPEILQICDYIIAVTNSDKRRIEFITNRDGIDESAALKRIKSQPDNDFYSNLADYVIENDCDIEALYKKSYEVIRRCTGEKTV